MFKKIIEDLISSGLSETEVGLAIGRTQSSVNRMKNGKQSPDYSAGEKLMRLHEKRCPKRARKPRPEARA